MWNFCARLSPSPSLVNLIFLPYVSFPPQVGIPPLIFYGIRDARNRARDVLDEMCAEILGQCYSLTATP